MDGDDENATPAACVIRQPVLTSTSETVVLLGTQEQKNTKKQKGNETESRFQNRRAPFLRATTRWRIEMAKKLRWQSVRYDGRHVLVANRAAETMNCKVHGRTTNYVIDFEWRRGLFRRRPWAAGLAAAAATRATHRARQKSTRKRDATTRTRPANDKTIWLKIRAST